MKQLIYRILRKLLRKQVIYGFNPYGLASNKRALLYYKTDWHYPFFMPKPLKGSTSYEVMSMATILNKNGFVVDIVDRSIDSFTLNHEYDVFVGVCNGGSGHAYTQLINQLSINTVKIAYSAGAHNKATLEKFNERIKYLKERKEINDIPSANRSVSITHDDALKKTDALFYCGYQFVPDSYSHIDIDKYRIVVPINEENFCDLSSISVKPQFKHSFLYYSGSGMLHKGLDILLDVFSKRSDIELHICAASAEPDFVELYDKEFNHASNIHYHGSVIENSPKMLEIVSRCGYIISLSCSDGDPASIATCMRYGLVPIVTPETDIAFDKAISCNSYLVEDVDKIINDAINMDDNAFQKLSTEATIAGLDNSTAALNYSFEKSLLQTIGKKHGYLE